MLLHPFMKGGEMVYSCVCLCEVDVGVGMKEREGLIDRQKWYNDTRSLCFPSWSGVICLLMHPAICGQQKQLDICLFMTVFMCI